MLTSCARKEARTNVPPPPLPEPSSTESTSRPEGAAKNGRLPGAASDADLAEPVIPAGTRPIATETGRQAWTAAVSHHVGSNGEVYNMHAMTAAHRTLPLGTIVR